MCGGTFGGNFWGKCKKRGGKTFLGGCWGSCEPQQILGARNFGGHFWGKCKKRGFGGECWGSCEPQKILGGEFLEKCQRKKCDAVGMVRNEKRENFPQKNLGDFFRGGVV